MSLLTGLISHWKLDEASGTRFDAHGSNHLADNNTVLSAAGKIGSAADFESTNGEFLSLSDNADLSSGATDFCFACWVQLESVGGENFSTVFAKDNATSGNREYALFYQKVANNFLFGSGRASSSTTDSVAATSFGAPSTATWYFIVCWYDRTLQTVNIQVNNGPIDSASKTIDPPDTAQTFFVGKLGNGQFFWDGLIDSLSFWKRVLTSTERTSLYNSGAGLDYADFGGGSTNATATATGSQAAGETGTVIASGSALTLPGGNQAGGETGSAVAHGNAAITVSGSQAAGETGTVVATNATIAQVTGVQAATETGNVAAIGSAVCVVLGLQCAVETGAATASNGNQVIPQVDRKTGLMNFRFITKSADFSFRSTPVLNYR